MATIRRNTIMNDNHHDPTQRELEAAQLTAYALGQLDPHQRAAVEAKLARSEKARLAVDEITALAEHVTKANRQGPSAAPSAALREAVENHLNKLEDSAMSTTPDRSPVAKSARTRWLWSLAALAVCLLVVAIPLLLPGMWSAREAARRQTKADQTSSPDYGADDSSVKAQGLPSEEARLSLELDAQRRAAERVVSRTETGYSARSDGAGDAMSITFGTKPVVILDGSASMPPAELSGPVPADPDPASSYRSVSREGKGGDPGRDPKGPRPTPQPSGQTAGPVGNSASGPAVKWDEPLLVEEWRGHKAALAAQGAKIQAEISSEVQMQADVQEQVKGLIHNKDGLTINGAAPLTITGGTFVKQPDGRPPQPTAEREESSMQQSLADQRQAAERVISNLETERTKLEQIGRTSIDIVLESAHGKNDPLYRPMPENPMRSEAGLETGGRELSERFPRQGGQFWSEGEVPGTEQYDVIVENPFVEAVGEAAVSTFSIDVDTASYANVRRFLNQGRLPPRNAVRIEELVNYFKYDYPLPDGEAPFSARMEVAGCPWNGQHRLLRVALKGREIDTDQRGPSNLVFLLDVSGSMRDGNKLPLVQQAMTMLVDQLGEDDRVAIVTYAGNAGLQLPSTGGHERDVILSTIDSLSAGGSTHGSAGIQLAYDQAVEHFVEGGTNRVILCTDGDLNVGITNDDLLVELITKKAQSGVFLTVLGFGTGNLKDSKMEKLADKGNGTYAYIDGLREAKKVLVEQLSGSLVTIAKDVKIQVIFNPAEVQSYRLIGYENRMLATRDFDDDKKDAGEIGAGHTVTALYEIVPADADESAAAKGPDLKYQRVPKYSLTKQSRSGEMLTLRLRYKQPDGLKSKLLEFTTEDLGKRFGEASADFRFASAVAAFGMVLRGSQYCGEMTLSAVEEFAAGGLGEDPGGYRQEFVELVRRARQFMPR